MRPPLAGRRAALRRLAGEARRRLAPVERALPISLTGGASPHPGEPVATSQAPADAAARIDAARDRLRATIEPHDADG